jgi:hypothetical protein
MAVDPADGAINIVFYDRRNLKDTMTGLTLARSVDGGKSFVNYRIDQEPFACEKDVFMGDYIGISAIGGRVVAAYCHLLGKKQTTLSAAVFQFKLGTQEAVPLITGSGSAAELDSGFCIQDGCVDFPCRRDCSSLRLRIASRCFLGRRR